MIEHRLLPLRSEKIANRALITFAVSLQLLPAMTRADVAYPIHISLPYFVGDVVRISVTAKYHSSKTPTDADPSHKATDETISVALDGIETVEAVDDKRRPSRFKIEIKSCTREGAQLMPAGAVIEVTSTNGRATYRVDGKAPDTRVERSLAEVVNISNPYQPGIDDAMGSEPRRHIGETWPANCALLAKSTQLPYLVTGDDFTGEGKLVAVSTVSGRLCETVQAATTCRFDRREGANGKTYENLRMRFEMTRTLPIDGRTHLDLLKFSRVVTNAVSGPDGHYDVKSERTYESKYDDASK